MTAQQISGDFTLECAHERASRGSRDSFGAQEEPDQPETLTIDSLTLSIGELAFRLERGDTAESFFERIERTLTNQ